MKKRSLFFILVCFGMLHGAEPTLYDIVHRSLPSDTIKLNNPMCITCHPVAFKSNPYSALEKLPVRSAAVESAEENPFCDPYTYACLCCHDGNTAKNAPVQMPLCYCDATDHIHTVATKSHAMLTGDMKSHPILVPYPDGKQGFNRLDDPLPPEWKKSKTVRDLLINGKIVCISCHLPHFSKETGFLRTPAKGAGLCLGCHRK